MDDRGWRPSDLELANFRSDLTKSAAWMKRSESREPRICRKDSTWIAIRLIFTTNGAHCKRTPSDTTGEERSSIRNWRIFIVGRAEHTAKRPLLFWGATGCNSEVREADPTTSTHCGHCGFRHVVCGIFGDDCRLNVQLASHNPLVCRLGPATLSHGRRSDHQRRMAFETLDVVGRI